MVLLAYLVCGKQSTERACMSSSHKKRQTMAKHTRERAVKEKRERKQEKKEEKKQALALERGDLADGPAAEDDAAPSG
jgi:hypothetical protein